MDKVLILGGSGLVGKAITEEMNKNKRYELYATYFNNPLNLDKYKLEGRCFKFDVEEMDNLDSILDAVKPNSIISCLRGDFSKQLMQHKKAAEYLKENGGKLYFFSTTNVFDNDLTRHHDEEDTPSSQTDYGKYKIECENKILEILKDKACILRIPMVWGKSSRRMKELLGLLKNNKEIEVYPKLIINTNTDEMIARQLCYIIDNDLNGIFHLASIDVVNYETFYNELAVKLGFANASFKENFEDDGYFALLSKRILEFPEDLRMTNKVVIDYLVR